MFINVLSLNAFGHKALSFHQPLQLTQEAFGIWYFPVKLHCKWSLRRSVKENEGSLHVLRDTRRRDFMGSQLTQLHYLW